MNIRRILSSVASLCVLVGVQNTYAAIDSNASVVQLRTDCTENGVTINNCFTDLTTAQNWIYAQRSPAPSVTSPVLLEIGPGQFNGMISCDESGYVTYRGAGMKNTTIGPVIYPASINNCQNITVIGLTLKSTGLGGKAAGGTTFWHDVEMDASSGRYAWFDNDNLQCNYENIGKHYWFNSRIVNNSSSPDAIAYGTACDESWFFGSEITVIYNGTGTKSTAITASRPGNNTGLKSPRGDVHIYGGVIRTISQSVSSTTQLSAIEVSKSASVHIHGAGIDVLASGTNPIIALSAITSGEIHANETAYNLKTGSGASITRVSKDATGHVHAPYLWETHADVPFAGTGITFGSVTGFDMAIVTTNSSGAADHPHMVIYDASCSSKWFDTTTGLCR